MGRFSIKGRTGAAVSEIDRDYATVVSADESISPDLRRGILHALLYYDIWEYPMKLEELHIFLPVRLPEQGELVSALASAGVQTSVTEYGGYYSVRPDTRALVDRRLTRERHARWMWRAARLVTHVIKRFPFVRAIFVSGDLSKNATGPGSDVDFFILTEPGRLWICRTLLILFKKIFLLNRKKFFCLNFFATIDNLTQEERNVYVAAEVAHLKPMYNDALFNKFMEENAWIRFFFPNFSRDELPRVVANNRQSQFQKLFERLLMPLPLDRIDTYLMEQMKHVWAQRYPRHDAATRQRIFKCTKQESRAYGGDFHDKVLALYSRKLREFGVEE